jgi:CheY-like chemotaxis protein
VSESATTAKKQILVVDDDPDSLAMLQVWLAQEEFGVTVAHDGFEALARVREQIPDLIITDNFMPGLSGMELCSKLRTSARTAHIPTILYTGRSSELTGGPCDRLIHKPASVRIASRNFVTGCLTGDVTAPFSPPRIRPSRFPG